MITNVVCSADLNCIIQLSDMVNTFVIVMYDPARFSGAQWKHRKIGGHCMVFSSGKIVVNGKTMSITAAKHRLRRYARRLQRLGCSVQLFTIHVVTISALCKLKCSIHLKNMCRFYRGSYEPELFPAFMFKKDSIHFTCFQSGTFLMTGIKRKHQIYDICIPTLLEIPFM